MIESAKVIECPRDAWQGLAKFIPTETKVAYLRRLLQAGFRHLDAVSFVSPKAVPQMADSEEVMRELFSPGEAAMAAERAGTKPPGRSPQIIGIVVNERGVERALRAPGVTTIGFPYSVSEQFARQNASMTCAESRALVEKITPAVAAAGRDLVVYISMAFGNHYGELWSPKTVEQALVWLNGVGVKMVSLADTVGKAEPDDVGSLFRAVKNAGEDVELGVHLHSRPETAVEKVLAAYEAGCRRFDSALTGLGGCPFAGDEMVGNIPTETVVSALSSVGVSTGIEPWGLLSAVEATQEIRRKFAQD